MEVWHFAFCYYAKTELSLAVIAIPVFLIMFNDVD